MRTVRTVADLRAALRPARRAERVIGLVPTMGALHEGHLSLIRHARATCDVVVVSLFVNPAQFDAAGDLAAYPRDEARDAGARGRGRRRRALRPAADEVYPPGFATTVHVSGLTETLEGAHRGVSHFDGVTTVVTKLLNMVRARRGLLRTEGRPAGARRPPRWSATSTCRCASRCARPCASADGLALSSRNVHLHGADRERALALRDALAAAEASLRAGERDAEVLRAAALAAMRGRGVEPEYLELVRPDDLSPGRPASTARCSSPSPPAWAAPVSSTTPSSTPTDSREAESP